MFWFFSGIFERTLRQNFHAVRLANRPTSNVIQAPQLVVYSNHPSWWDGVSFVYIANRLFHGRKAYTPIDAAMLKRYGFLGRIGTFGLEKETPRGAIQFLSVCKLVFADNNKFLLITAQGRFADVRERPLRLDPGIAHLNEIGAHVTFLPLAIEYTHWLEKAPELLLRFGEPLAGAHLAPLRPANRLERLEGVLTETMDKLAHDSIARNEAAFETLALGHTDINPIYDMWRRMKATLTGKPFDPSHGASLDR
jgi:1-acyl-sn-glycerol-3-phosphate acyltransferase